MKNCASLLLLALLCLYLTTSCITGSTLRTARVLEENQLEISGGATWSTESVGQAVILAYGVTEDLEIEARWEDNFVAATPRLQLLRSEKSLIDALAFFEIGYNDYGTMQWGPGVMIGRRWKCIEPYLSYRFRHFNSTPKHVANFSEFKATFRGATNFHYFKAGSRFYISDLWTKSREEDNCRRLRVFIDLEVGPTFFSHKGSNCICEWAANVGLNY